MLYLGAGEAKANSILDKVVNQQVGEYILEQQIGGGASGVVYRAFQPTVNRFVALKLIHMPSEAIPGEILVFERRFTQEAQVLASLEHPHIVPVYHYGIVRNEWAYIAMRLMHQSLTAELANGPFTAERVTGIALQLIDGLGYAHKNGVIHRDIKPENILFDEAGSACLADFGLARVADRTLDLKEMEALRSGALYVSPEQIRSASMDHRCDIYSLGAIMYQMLTGHAPFEVDDRGTLSLLRRIESEEPIPPRKLVAGIPPELERVVMQALQKEPRERFFDVAEMAAALELVPGTRLRTRVPAARTGGTAKTGRKRPWQQRRYQMAIAAFVLAAILIVLIALAAGLRGNMPPPVATILVSTHGTLDDAVPSTDETAQALRRLGTNGFVAYIACNFDSQFEAARAREMSDQATEYGVAYRAYDSAGDAYKQLTLIEQARLDGARAFILCPLKPSVLADSLTSIRAANIPLVLTDALPRSFGGVMLDQNDNAIGALVAQITADTLLAKSVKQANVVILDQPDYSFSEARVDGFMATLRERVPEARVIGQFPSGADQKATQAAVTALLASGQRIDAIFSVTDQGAYGAITALTAAQIDPAAVVVVSVNAESIALTNIYNRRYLLASVDIARLEGSRGALDAAIKLLGGGTLPEILSLPSGILITRDIIAEQPPNG